MIKARSEKLFKFIFVISIFVFISSVGFKLYLCNSMTVKNGKFEQVFVRRKMMEEELEKLRFENSALSSISYLEEKSKEMGFVEMSERLISIDPNAPIQVAFINPR